MCLLRCFSHPFAISLFSFSSFIFSGERVAGWLGGVLLPAEAGAPAQHGGEVVRRQGGQRALGQATGAPSHQKQNVTHIYVICLKIWLCNLCVCHLQLKIPQFFTDVEVVPALLHGDLWGGNVAECAEGPVIFDPASFYGHSEFELGIAGMFGGFSSSFYSAYHEKIPKVPGFAKRNQLYQLFHYLNHWNHFGGGYRGSSIRIMKDLLK